MTGRHSCPPEWVVQLQQLLQALGAQEPVALAGVPLTLLSDATGKAQGFAGVVYDGAHQVVRVLKFDSQMQPLPAGSHLIPWPAVAEPGSGQPHSAVQRLQIAVEKVFVLPLGASVPSEGRRITVRDAAQTVVAEMVVDSTLLQPLQGVVVAYPCGG